MISYVLPQSHKVGTNGAEAGGGILNLDEGVVLEALPSWSLMLAQNLSLARCVDTFKFELVR